MSRANFDGGPFRHAPILDLERRRAAAGVDSRPDLARAVDEMGRRGAADDPRERQVLVTLAEEVRGRCAARPEVVEVDSALRPDRASPAASEREGGSQNRAEDEERGPRIGLGHARCSLHAIGTCLVSTRSRQWTSELQAGGRVERETTTDT